MLPLFGTLWPCRLLASRYLAEDFFDLVDLDCFGSDAAALLPAALDALRWGEARPAASSGRTRTGSRSAGGAQGPGDGGEAAASEEPEAAAAAERSGGPDSSGSGRGGGGGGDGGGARGREGGLLYLTATDGFSAAGRRPERALAAYGGYPRAMPWANEQVGGWPGGRAPVCLAACPWLVIWVI